MSVEREKLNIDEKGVICAKFLRIWESMGSKESKSCALARRKDSSSIVIEDGLINT